MHEAYTPKYLAEKILTSKSGLEGERKQVTVLFADLAAVIGKDVPYPLLQAIAELPEEELRRGLTHLQAAEFRYEASLFLDLEYTFKHALTHEVTYGSLLQERRRTLHARIVEAVEQLYPDRLTEQVHRLAHHAFRGEVWAPAASYLRQAGAKAAARSAHREAVTSFEHALVALKHLPESRARIEQAIDLRLELRNALLPLGQLGGMPTRACHCRGPRGFRSPGNGEFPPGPGVPFPRRIREGDRVSPEERRGPRRRSNL